MATSKNQMVREEQRILDDLIQRMEKVGYSLQRTLTGSIAKLNNAKDSSVAEAYGTIVDAANSIKSTEAALKEFHRSRDELYDTRLVLEYVNSEEQGKDDLKVGLHDYSKNGEIYVISWLREACRPFILNDSLTEMDCDVTKHGECYSTHYTLKLKRQIDMVFDTVKDVTHLFPLISEEEEQVVADEFLKELLRRRTEQEFQNIVFSIQKQQGEIIQTPFYQNMIVQGCAGSGKSMIMLHRLPVILFDNLRALNRNNLYIITPSITYIQMANNMRIDLEIDDLSMGTLNQYYDHVISKYGSAPDVYGTINPGIHLPKELQDYVYSEKAIHFIQDGINTAIAQMEVDTEKGLRLFAIEERTIKNDIPAYRLRNKLSSIQRILEENDKVLRQKYYTPLKKSIEELTEIGRMLSSRKTAVKRSLRRQISEAQNVIIKVRKEQISLDPEKNKNAYENRQASIKAASARISECNTLLHEVETEDGYFNTLKELGMALEKVLSLFSLIRNEWHEIDIDHVYSMVERKKLLCDSYARLSEIVNKIGDRYWEYAVPMNETIEKAKSGIQQLIVTSDKYLPLEYQKTLVTANAYYSSLAQDLVDSIYLSIMKQLGNAPKEGKKISALSCSPYIYLQILYQYQGPPNSAKESLITIDEAQNLAPEELRLISNVNDRKVIFNLFGDVKQHFEESKGIDSWNEFSTVFNYRLYNMRENYRNARQITDHCNRVFNMSMRAINTDGRGAHILDTSVELYEQLRTIFQRSQNTGLSCIIAKSSDEANTIYEKMGALQTRIHNMASDPSELKPVKWNLMTIDQTKGLEFETVIAVSGRMTENEKYVAFTRALDELFIFDAEIELLPAHEEKDNNLSFDKQTSHRKKRKKKNSEKEQTAENTPEISCKEFFEQAGLEVIDTRNNGGYLWVIGSREKIESTVNRAIEKYGISGVYSAGKATHFRQGWYTKTKK